MLIRLLYREIERRLFERVITKNVPLIPTEGGKRTIFDYQPIIEAMKKARVIVDEFYQHPVDDMINIGALKRSEPLSGKDAWDFLKQHVERIAKTSLYNLPLLVTHTTTRGRNNLYFHARTKPGEFLGVYRSPIALDISVEQTAK